MNNNMILDPELLPQGWKTLCKSLDLDIRSMIGEGKIGNFSVTDLKEKYGELRLYYDADGDTQSLDELINDYTHISCHTCASCGAFPAPLTNGGWWLPECPSCYAQRTKTELSYEDIIIEKDFNPIRRYTIYLPGSRVRISRDTSYLVDRIREMKERDSDEDN